MNRSLFRPSWILCAALALVACGELPQGAEGPESAAARAVPTGAVRAYPAQYGGMVLPTPPPVKAPFGADVRLPGAWVAAEAGAVPATWGTYTYAAGEQRIHADADLQQLKTSIRRVEVPAGEALTLVVGSGSIEKIEATLQEWDTSPLLPFDPSAERLQIRAQGAGKVTTYALDRLDGGQDRLLTVSVEFRGGDEAMYFWRLHPEGPT